MNSHVAPVQAPGTPNYFSSRSFLIVRNRCARYLETSSSRPSPRREVQSGRVEREDSSVWGGGIKSRPRMLWMASNKWANDKQPRQASTRGAAYTRSRERVRGERERELGNKTIIYSERSSHAHPKKRTPVSGRRPKRTARVCVWRYTCDRRSARRRIEKEREGRGLPWTPADAKKSSFNKRVNGSARTLWQMRQLTSLR